MVGRVSRWGAVVGLGVVLVAAGAGCGDDGSGDDAGSGSGGAEDAEMEDLAVVEGSEAEVIVLDNTFNEQNIQVQVGTRVVWANDGRQDHDIVAVDDEASFGVDRGDFEPDAVYEHTFDQPGTYRYFCSLHGTESAGMVGAVVVED
ncbi:MAG: cupredoxin domain-containing protein [Acidimicrobiales bacterium]